MFEKTAKGDSEKVSNATIKKILVGVTVTCLKKAKGDIDIMPILTVSKKVFGQSDSIRKAKKESQSNLLDIHKVKVTV